MNRVLVVDDKEMMRDSVATTLSRRGYSVVAAPGGAAAIEKFSNRPVDVVVTDLQMPEMTGLELLAELRRLDDEIPVIVITAFGSIETAVAAIKQGAWDYITKPFSGDELAVAVDRAIEHRRLQRDNQILRAAVAQPAQSGAARRHELIGSGGCMATLRERLARVADSHGTVMIAGESGAGKEVAARWVHEHSPRAQQPFLAINCAALSANLLESELFGHERGAFTGADRMRKGRFELADGGTLLLDEISEIDPSIQAKLLRVLQEQTFERVGSSRSITVDVRVIATSNRDLVSEVQKGTFRQDLFYRLNVLPLTLPPLRSHPEDIPDLAAHFLALVAGREGRPARTIAPEAMDLLRAYPWPGNVRELQNICERAAVLSTADRIEAELLRPWLSLPGHHPGDAGMAGMAGMISSTSHAPPRSASVGATVELKPGAGVVCDGETVTLEQIEREAIVATLRRYDGHRARSARALGIGIRTLGLKLKKWKEERLVEASL